MSFAVKLDENFSPELQRLAYEKGLIPFIPADRSSRDP